MRDEWADEMILQFEKGYLTSDVDLIVDGLKQLFSFLEAMKLVRCLALAVHFKLTA